MAKYFYRSAIDTALKTNQIRAVGCILEYIVKYQNTYVSSFLFSKNIPKLMEKGVPVAPLLNSDIFCYKFDCDEWPSTHTDDQTYMRPYNKSIFDLRANYSSVFPEEHLQLDVTKAGDEEVIIDSSKVYKISYKVNLLPVISEHVHLDPSTGEFVFRNQGVSLLAHASDSDELEIFESENYQSLLVFKW